MSEQTPKAVCPDGSAPQVPKTPAEPPKITRSEKTYKPKDPRRVEAGKRLAAISKSAKEKKARDRADRESSPTDRAERGREDREESQRGSVLDWTIPVGGLITAGLVGLYYAYDKKKVKKSADPPKDEGASGASGAEPKPRQRRSQLDSFDD